MAKQPNILWICTDRQRFDTLGCYGNRWVTTPHLDRLAQQGVVFDQAWSQCSICAPSRASFLTGRYPSTTRLNRNGQTIPASERLISRLLADNRYICGLAGKYHLSAGAPDVTQWSEKRVDDGYVVFDWSLHPPATPVCNYTAWLSEHGVEFKHTPVNGSEYVTFGMPPETSNLGWVAQRAINFIKCNAELDRPWMFSCNIEAPHNPYDPPREFLEPYLKRLDEIPLPAYTPGELDNKPVFQHIDRAGVWGGGNGYFAAEKMSPEDHRLIRAGYWALVDHIDYQVGRMLAALEQTGQLENTIVVFMSDHGEMMGDHGIYFQGAYFYEPMHHIPFIMSWPGGMRGGRRVPAMVEMVDLAPTLLQATGLEIHPGMQGRSLWPILSGTADASQHRDDVFSEYYQAIPGGYRTSPNHRAHATCVRSRDYMLAVYHGEDIGELYDLKKDPGEVRNLWDDPAYVAVKAAMLKRLCERMGETIDPLPPCVAPY